MTTTPLPAIPADAASDDFVRCLHCEYSLRGLEREGNCPECGTPTEQSWRRHELEVSQGWTPLALVSTTFLRRMGWGCALLLTAAGTMVLGMLLSVMSHPPSRLGSVGILLWLSSTLALAAGLWLLGSLKPAALRPRKAVRYLIRGGAFLPLADALFSMLAIRFLSPWINWYSTKAILETVLAAIITCAVYRRLIELLRRGAANRLRVRVANFLCWAWPPLMLVQVLLFGSLDVTPSSGWMVTPTVALGHVMALVLLPYTLITWPRFELVHGFWSLLVLMTLTTLFVLIDCALVFFSAANRDRDRKDA
jgi:hypothetical protein